MTTLESACSWTWKLQLQTTDLPHSSDEFLVTPTSDLAPLPEIISASIPWKVAEVSIVKITIIVKSVLTLSCVEQGDLNQWLTARYLWRFRAISHWHADQHTRILLSTCIDFANMGKFARKLLSGDEYQIYLRGGSPTPAPTVYVKQMVALISNRPISLHIESQRSTLTYIPWINILSSFIWHEIIITPLYLFFYLLRATRGARNPNLLAVFTHASHVCCQHLFGLPLRTNGMHWTQFDHACFDLLPLVIWSRVFWLSVTWNLRKAQLWNKSVLTFGRCRPQLCLILVNLFICLFYHEMTLVVAWSANIRGRRRTTSTNLLNINADRNYACSLE